MYIEYNSFGVIMVLAYVLVKIESGKDADVFDEITKLDKIRSAYTTYGIYDIIIEIDLSEIEEVDEFIFQKLRQVPGVRETVTMIVSKTLV